MISIQTIAGGVIAVTAALGSYKMTANSYEAKISKMETRSATAARVAESKNREIELLGLELMGMVSQRDAARNQELNVVERIITKKVIEYVKNPDAGKCNIPGEFVQLHDTAARGGGVSETSEASGAIDAAPARITDTEVIVVVTDNYNVCHGIRNQLLSLQDWVKLSITLGE